MTFIEIFKKYLSDKDEIIKLRYRWSKIVFLVFTFLFFLSFFFSWARFYNEIFSSFIWIFLFLSVLSLDFYLYYLFKSKLSGKINNLFIYILLFIIYIFTSLFMLPIFFEGWFLGILNTFL